MALQHIWICSAQYNDDFMCQPCWLAVNHVFRGERSPAASNSCHFCGLIKWLMRHGSGIKRKYWLVFVLKESKGTVWTRHHWELQEAALGNVERQKQPWLCPEMRVLRFVQLHVRMLELASLLHSSEGTVPVQERQRGKFRPGSELERKKEKQLHASN